MSVCPSEYDRIISASAERESPGFKNYSPQLIYGNYFPVREHLPIIGANLTANPRLPQTCKVMTFLTAEEVYEFQPAPNRCPGTARDEITVSPAWLKGRSHHCLPADGNYFMWGRVRFSMRCARHGQIKRG